jgi:hypothetical protein
LSCRITCPMPTTPRAERSSWPAAPSWRGRGL